MNKTVIFTVPDLARIPIQGGGCCAVSSEWLIQEALGQLPGVQEIQVDDERGQVNVAVDLERTSVRQIAEELEALGFSPAGILIIKEVLFC